MSLVVVAKHVRKVKWKENGSGNGVHLIFGDGLGFFLAACHFDRRPPKADGAEKSGNIGVNLHVRSQMSRLRCAPLDMTKGAGHRKNR